MLYIAMLEARATEKSVYDFTNQPSLAGPLLGQIMVEKGHHVRCFAPQVAPIDWDYVFNKADVVGITALTLNAQAAYELARTCKEHGKTVVMGGSHVSFLPDEALERGVDFVVRREGHATFPELIKAIEAKKNDFSHIPGLSYKTPDGKHVHNEDRPFCSQEEFAALPIPNIQLLYGWENINSVPVLTQWGCPESCEFCSVIQMCGRKIKYRPVESVLAQLERLIAIYGQGVAIFFCADNFFANRKQAEQLLQGIIDRKLVIEAGLQMRIDAICDKDLEVDRDLLFLMRSAGIRIVYMGLESANQETLDIYHKRFTVEQVQIGVKALVERKFHVHGMFVQGGDTDDESVFEKTVRFARKLRIHTVQIINLMPLPGTPLYYRLDSEGRIISKEWSLYTGQYALIAPKLMSAYRLQVGTIYTLSRFYSRSYTFWLALRSSPHTAWLLIREHRLRWNLFKAGLSLLTGKGEILHIIADRLPARVKREMLPINLAFLRLWARNQIGTMKRQTKGYLRLLREKQRSAVRV